MERISKIERNTLETKIKMEFNIDGKGEYTLDTGIGFFDHMLSHISKHGFFDLSVNAQGDLEVDSHHLIEDTGIVFGKCISKALGDKKGIKRMAHSIVPMDEALVLCAVDISGRPYLVFDAEFTVPKLGDFDTEMTEEFFRAVSDNAGLNIHIKVLAGKNNHHIAEAIFKAFGRALDMASGIDERINGVLSTKGMLE